MSYKNQIVLRRSSPRLGLPFTWQCRSIWNRLAASGLVALSAGCLERPIATSEPATTNVVVQHQANSGITSIDLLLMIDNSSSMADKQATLAAAVPQLLAQLVQPQCVDAQGKPFHPPLQAMLGVDSPCSQGSPEFNPVNDIHIGVVTSSLGDHGGGALCTEKQPVYTGSTILQPPDVNDKSHLMGTLQRGLDALAADTNGKPTALANVDEQGFLAWGNDQHPSPSDGDLNAATSMFRDMVSAAAEKGCGLEAQLEGWFRFLVDPVPPTLPLAPPDKDSRLTSRQGVDDALLAQRARFLRPDSLVAIIMLTDENDCSLRDSDVGWLATSGDPIATGSTPCDTNPNDKCCYSCTVLQKDGAVPPNGCPVSCPSISPGQPMPAGAHDGANQMNLRCWQQKRRFGYEFTYPTSRYTVALTKKELCPDQTFGDMDCDCSVAKSIGVGCDPGKRKLDNPLYSNRVGRKSDGVTDVIGYPQSVARTDNSAIFLAGIVGVPWQDISEPDSQADGATLKYVPVTDPRWTASGGIWDKIVADYNDHDRTPGDPRMIESIVPRDGLPPPTAGVDADPINGHEWNTGMADLEYACIYRLPTPEKCECLNATDVAACKYQHPNDCCVLKVTSDAEGNHDVTLDKPLCQDPQTGAYEANTQYFAKGYPGLRELSVLHDYATSGQTPGNSIVASICPKDLTSDFGSPGYGYNPAVAALIDRLKDRLRGSCLPRPLTVASNGEVPCYVIEAVAPDALDNQDCASFCHDKGRNQDVAGDNPSGSPSAQVQSAVFTSMRQSGICDQPGQALKCSDMCLCSLPQERIDQKTLSDAPYDNDLVACQNADDHTASRLKPGYCYVDPGLKDENGQSLAGSNPDLVAKCPDTQRRILRFVGNHPTAASGTAVPLTGAMVFSACQGSSITENNQ